MFYNFVWIWGSDKRNQNLFTDWGSYDFTVSEKALDDFAAQYGYTLTAEDFMLQRASGAACCSGGFFRFKDTKKETRS